MNLRKLKDPLRLQNPIVADVRESQKGLQLMKEIMIENSPPGSKIVTIGIGLSGATIGVWMQLNIRSELYDGHVQVRSFGESTHRGSVTNKYLLTSVNILDPVALPRAYWILDDDVFSGSSLMHLISVIGYRSTNLKIEGLIAKRLGTINDVARDKRIFDTLAAHKVDIKTWYYSTVEFINETSKYFPGYESGISSDDKPSDSTSIPTKVYDHHTREWGPLQDSLLSGTGNVGGMFSYIPNFPPD